MPLALVCRTAKEIAAFEDLTPPFFFVLVLKLLTYDTLERKATRFLWERGVGDATGWMIAGTSRDGTGGFGWCKVAAAAAVGSEAKVACL